MATNNNDKWGLSPLLQHEYQEEMLGQPTQGWDIESEPPKPLEVPELPELPVPPSPSGGSGYTSAPAPNYSTERNTIAPISNYDPATNAAYMQAMEALEAARGQVPTYTNSYADQLNNLYAQITNRDPFKYDLDSDPIYQQYRDQYMMQGQQAMMDTMGQAAALTGGYGSTYSQAVGQQQYNAYLQDLNSVVPDLYNNAYNQWLNSGNELYNQYNLTQQAAADEYGKYRDAVGDWWNNVDYAWQNAQQEYNRGLDQWEREYQLNNDAIARQQDEYSRLMELMSVGYTPSAEEIANAGMSEAEYAAWDTYIKSQNAGGGGGGGGGAPITDVNQLGSAAKNFYTVFANDTDGYKGSSDAYRWQVTNSLDRQYINGQITAAEYIFLSTVMSDKITEMTTPENE